MFHHGFRSQLRRNAWGPLAALLMASAGLLGTPARVAAGPIPGVESFEKTAVDFPHPKHLDVWDIGNDEYLVTFRWKPTGAVSKPGVAGTFNEWSRTDLPMEGPGADGFYSVTARVGVGDLEYKFIEGDAGWHTDPLNPDQANGNSLLRLGVTALLRDLKWARGDGQMETRAFLHDPAKVMFLDRFASDEVLLRLRTLRGDLEGAALLDVAADPTGAAPLPMTLAASDAQFDYYEAHVKLMPREGEARKGELSTRGRYAFVAYDGGETTRTTKEWPAPPISETFIDTPQWARDAIWYQVMIDRFRDGDPSNNPEQTTASTTVRTRHTHPWGSEWYTEQPWERGADFSLWKFKIFDRLYGGDFQGLIDKLDYIGELGATAIYLNPVFESAQAHKYNARSYVHADDGYGVAGEFDKAVAVENENDPATWVWNASDKKLVELIAEIHQREMKVIFDGVFNHLGDNAVSFEDVLKHGKGSRYADWYDVTSWDPLTWTGWGGFKGLPEFRKDDEHGIASEGLRRNIYGITRRWMDPNGDGDPSDGIDGWRLDVPMEVPMPFWVEWCKYVRSINPEAYIVGEVWDPAEQWLDGTKFDAVMNYQFAKIAFRYFGNKQHKLSASDFDRELARLRIRYPRASTYALQNLYDSHDTDRWVSRLANPDMDYDGGNRVQDNGPNYMDERPAEVHFRRMRPMAILQATYVGAPMIWYGTELGMWGADDPMCRLPMWWDDKGPYENKDYRPEPTLMPLFKELFALRKSHAVLRGGDYTTLLAADAADCFVFARHGSRFDEALVIAFNNSEQPQTIAVPVPAASVLPKGFTGVSRVWGNLQGEPNVAEDGKLTLTLPALDGVVLRVGQ